MEQIPVCEAIGPDGERVVIRPHATTDSVADLARALDLPAAMPVAIDDRPVAPTERLVGAGLQVGSTITVAHRHDPPARTGGGVVDVAIVVGPACERWLSLPPGRHAVGRATTATIRIDDPAVELHHGVLDVAEDATFTFTQLTGAFPATISGSVLTIGSSRLVVRGRDRYQRPGRHRQHRPRRTRSLAPGRAAGTGRRWRTHRRSRSRSRRHRPPTALHR